MVCQIFTEDWRDVSCLHTTVGMLSVIRRQIASLDTGLHLCYPGSSSFQHICDFRSSFAAATIHYHISDGETSQSRPMSDHQ